MKKPVEEESGEKAPLWIISFADMISLLMAFFVMLQTMAASNSNTFMTTGRDKLIAVSFEFRRNISGFGIPGLFGSPRIDRRMGFTGDQFKLSSSDTNVTDETRDPQTEQTRRLFTKLTEHAKIGRTRFDGREQVYQIVPVTFDGMSAQLNNSARQYLTQYVTILGQDRQLDGKSICVVGIAADLEDEVQQWTCSEQRARAVAQFIQSLLPPDRRDNVYWWGAGAAMNSSKADRSPSILIAID